MCVTVGVTCTFRVMLSVMCVTVGVTCTFRVTLSVMCVTVDAACTFRVTLSVMCVTVGVTCTFRVTLSVMCVTVGAACTCIALLFGAEADTAEGDGSDDDDATQTADHDADDEAGRHPLLPCSLLKIGSQMSSHSHNYTLRYCYLKCELRISIIFGPFHLCILIECILQRSIGPSYVYYYMKLN